ncbi:inorganic pyrophosphatase 3 isoform X1 [Gossypium australe]|uniref:Inorganic pyrophosphatase 3 isoform X1 n=3 Tax=Gossypium TaxID=3633 RepID=A0A5B6X7E7_9ROSI|nr:inorganic pyrophosphatase 3 isoform X1 [Gossypium australe]
MAAIVVVFDFDRTLIDGDSDSWVVTEMGLSDLFHQLRSTLPWNSLMDRMMKELHFRGETADDIAECLKKTPVHPRIAAAIKAAHAFGCDLRILSDANQFFIEKILEHHDLLGCFSKIYTNPTFVDEEGRLRIFPYHDSTLSPHGCSLCPSNLHVVDLFILIAGYIACGVLISGNVLDTPSFRKELKGNGIAKIHAHSSLFIMHLNLLMESVFLGQVLNNIQASAPESERQNFIYLGDGSGDYCPTLKLGDKDYVMPRKNYPLWNCIFSDRAFVKAEVREWSNGEELEGILLHLINRISSERSIL